MDNKNVRVVECCATCFHSLGWLDNLGCAITDNDTRAYYVCDKFIKDNQDVWQTKTHSYKENKV